jgi:hypothetical protein
MTTNSAKDLQKERVGESETNFDIMQIFRARYKNNVQDAFASYIAIVGDTPETCRAVIDQLVLACQDPQLQRISPLFPDYTIPQELLENGTHVRTQLLQRIPSSAITAEQTLKFLTANHEAIKYSLNQWFLANPGIMLEIFTITDKLAPSLLQWLSHFDQPVALGDQVVHPHFLSNDGRRRLQDMGFEIPYHSRDGRLYWHENYLHDGLRIACYLASSHPANKGIFIDGSWALDPQLYPEEGEAIVNFTFLRRAELIGHRLRIPQAEVDPQEYQKQVGFFARTSTRRQQLLQKGFDIRLYASFYPVHELQKAIADGKI